MADSYGLVTATGVAISGTNDWTSSLINGHVELTFERDVSIAVVVATQHTPYCDGLTRDAIQVAKNRDDNRIICIYHARSSFGFALWDAEPRAEGKGVDY